MIAWVLWFFVALHLFLLDGLLVSVSDWSPDLSLAVGLFCVLYARPSALPGILLCAALSRSVLLEGSAAIHLLTLGLPVAVLLPLRVVFSKRSLIWQCLASGFLAFMIPRLGGLLFRVTGDGVAAVDSAPPASEAGAVRGHGDVRTSPGKAPVGTGATAPFPPAGAWQSPGCRCAAAARGASLRRPADAGDLRVACA